MSLSTLRQSATQTSRFRVLGWVTLALLVVLFVSCRQKGDLPERSAILPELMSEPVQTDTRRDDFVMSYRGSSIRVQPVAEYEIWGLVVSHNNIESIADIYHDSSSVDTKDLCVIWGNNLRGDDYQRVDFWSGPWTCYYRFPGGVSFDGSALSNSHLITDQERLRKALADVRVGDQIRFSGALVNYQAEDWGDFWRRSSTVRTDGGNGACEVVFFEELEVLRAGTPGWYLINGWAKALLALVPLV